MMTNRKLWTAFGVFYDNLTTQRVAAGLKIAALARVSGVSESTIRRIEKHGPTTEETIHALINALNTCGIYQRKPIDPSLEAKAKSRFGTKS